MKLLKLSFLESISFSILISLFLVDSGGLPLGLLSTLGFCIYPGAYHNNSFYFSLMFLLNMREQGRIAKVSLATRALVVSGKCFMSLDGGNLLSKDNLLWIIHFNLIINTLCKASNWKLGGKVSLIISCISFRHLENSQCTKRCTNNIKLLTINITNGHYKF